MYELPKIFVKVGEGRKVPLPIPGGGSVPGLGGYVERTMEVERLITNGDLVECDPPAPEPAPVVDQPAAAASSKKGA